MKNTIKTCLCIAVLMYCTKSIAQVDTSTTQKLLQYIFQPIDKNQIPTGFLEEYGCPMLPAATFNGTLTDSNRIDMNLWRTLYFQLQTGWTRVSANPLPAITHLPSNVSPRATFECRGRCGYHACCLPSLNATSSISIKFVTG